jgi:hypothetical protein
VPSDDDLPATSGDSLQNGPTPTGLSRRALIGAAGAAGILLGSQILARPQAANAAVPFPLANPYTAWGLNDDFYEHLSRTKPSQAPGLDYGLPVGTPVVAPAAGAVTFTYGTNDNGWYATITHPGGWRSQLLHLSGFAGSARSVAMGEIVGYSGGRKGAPGAGSSNGPHLHWSLITPAMVYVDPLPQVNTGTIPPPGTPIPLPQEEDENMKWYLRPDGTQTIAGAFSWVDYGIPERAQIVGTLLCDQTAPISISLHQWNILHEEYLIRVGQYKVAFPGSA